MGLFKSYTVCKIGKQRKSRTIILNIEENLILIKGEDKTEKIINCVNSEQGSNFKLPPMGLTSHNFFN